jgi:hypothetical protein
MSIYALTNVKSIKPVPASEIASAAFVQHEVLNEVEDKRVRLTNLSKAVTLGTGAKQKTSLTFDTLSGMTRTEEIVLAFDKDHVWVSGNIKLPMQALRSVDFL